MAESQPTAPAGWDDVSSESLQQESALGPATLPEFADAAGLDTLAQQQPKRGRKPREESVTTAPAVAPVLTGDQLSHALAQLDKTVSVLLDVPAEDAEYMRGVADAVLPLANHFAAKSESIVALAIFAGLGLFSYVVVKYQRFRMRLMRPQQQRAEHGEETTSKAA